MIVLFAYKVHINFYLILQLLLTQLTTRYLFYGDKDKKDVYLYSEIKKKKYKNRRSSNKRPVY